jgi:rhomboid protease GluP
METRRMCPQCRAFITTSDRICPYCETQVGPRAIDRRQPSPILGGLIPHAHFTTTIILLINFGLYAATTLYSMRTGHEEAFMNIDGRTLFDFGAKLREAILFGQWWRLITAGFLHGGLMHLLMNSWVLFDLGAQVEELYGASRLIVIYFLATVAGFFASTWWSPALSVGASAGLFGLIGAMIALGTRHPLGAAVRGLYVRWAIYGLLLGLLPGLQIDNAAHLGGLVAGLVCGYLAGVPKLILTWGERLWRAAAYFCVLLTAFSFLQMYLWFATSAG